VTNEIDLCQAFIDAYPDDAARAVEGLPSAQAAALVAAMSPETAARALSRMAPTVAADCLERAAPDCAAAVLLALRVDRAAVLLRQIADAATPPILQQLPADERGVLLAVLRHPHGTAGALMDRRVVSTSESATAGEALSLLRRSTRHAHDYVYVVDGAHRLAGVVGLDQLLVARAGTPVSTIMTLPVSSLSVHANRAAILAHAGWRQFRALPVVDDGAVLLGAISHEAFRALEQDSPPSSRGQEAATTIFALGELYWLGLSGMVDALASAVRRGTGAAQQDGGSHGSL
jgi:Mg/Co/Ni transporter MgtE